MKLALKMRTQCQKQELIEEQKQIFLHERIGSWQKKITIRQIKLFNDSVISQAEFEIYESTNHLAETNVQIAYSELISLQTGEKIEEIQLIQQRIDSYSREIEILESLKEQYYIMPPISGVVNFNIRIDGILTVSDTSNYILKIPVKGIIFNTSK